MANDSSGRATRTGASQTPTAPSPAATSLDGATTLSRVAAALYSQTADETQTPAAAREKPFETGGENLRLGQGAERAESETASSRTSATTAETRSPPSPIDAAAVRQAYGRSARMTTVPEVQSLAQKTASTAGTEQGQLKAAASDDRNTARELLQNEAAGLNGRSLSKGSLKSDAISTPSEASNGHVPSATAQAGPQANAPRTAAPDSRSTPSEADDGRGTDPTEETKTTRSKLPHLPTVACQAADAQAPLPNLAAPVSTRGQGNDAPAEAASFPTSFSMSRDARGTAPTSTTTLATTIPSRQRGATSSTPSMDSTASEQSPAAPRPSSPSAPTQAAQQKAPGRPPLPSSTESSAQQAVPPQQQVSPSATAPASRKGETTRLSSQSPAVPVPQGAAAADPTPSLSSQTSTSQQATASQRVTSPLPAAPAPQQNAVPLRRTPVAQQTTIGKQAAPDSSTVPPTQPNATAPVTNPSAPSSAPQPPTIPPRAFASSTSPAQPSTTGQRNPTSPRAPTQPRSDSAQAELSPTPKAATASRSPQSSSQEPLPTAARGTPQVTTPKTSQSDSHSVPTSGRHPAAAAIPKEAGQPSPTQQPVDKSTVDHAASHSEGQSARPSHTTTLPRPAERPATKPQAVSASRGSSSESVDEPSGTTVEGSGQGSDKDHPHAAASTSGAPQARPSAPASASSSPAASAPEAAQPLTTGPGKLTAATDDPEPAGALRPRTKRTVNPGSDELPSSSAPGAPSKDVEATSNSQPEAQSSASAKATSATQTPSQQHLRTEPAPAPGRATPSESSPPQSSAVGTANAPDPSTQPAPAAVSPAPPMPVINTVATPPAAGATPSVGESVQVTQVAVEAASIYQHAAEDSGLAVTVLPHVAHLSFNSDDGDLSLHVRVRDGNADVNVSGSMAPIFESKAPEMRTLLANQGLGLGSFAADQHGQGRHPQQHPESVPSDSHQSHTAPPARPRTTAVESDSLDEGRIHITA
jgi:hypothetical protein